MYRPVGPALGELPSSVERIDDPDPLCSEPTLIVGGFLAEHEIAGRCRGQLGGEEALRCSVASFTSLGQVHVTPRRQLTQREQQRACLRGEAVRRSRIGSLIH
jgi:hypothetical protein